LVPLGSLPRLTPLGSEDSASLRASLAESKPTGEEVPTSAQQVAPRSALNRDVAPARPREFETLRIGPLAVWPPVVLAPMAGVTNAPFRTLCRRFGAGLYVSEMITARALVEGNAKTLRLAEFAPDEKPRSLQLYGVDPVIVGEAVAQLVGENRVDHIDMNFGCPVRKVTSRGGGSAIPARPRLLARIVAAAVANAGAVPVTIKFRIGVDESIITFLDAGRIAQEEGCAAVALHARTAAQLYDGEADWNAIGELKRAVKHIPVLGNGDVWEAWDALRMMRATGCDGVVVGRGCLGRPWLFRELAQAFDGREPEASPTLGGVCDILLEHAELLVRHWGERGGIRSFRKHATWYTKCFPGGARVRSALVAAESLAQLADALAGVPREAAFPAQALRVARGKHGGRQRVSLPEGWLTNRDDATPPGREAEDAESGG
jgi:nifR3 family TIM-barrel protein